MDPTVYVQYGFASGLLAFMAYVIKELWADNRALRAQMHEDQAAMLPALNASTATLKTALEESIRGRVIAERESRS